MGRGKDYQKPTLPIDVHTYLDEQSKLFALCVAVLGMQQARAYKLVFGGKASMSSCAVLASNLMRDRYIQWYIEELHSFHYFHALKFNESAIKTIKD